MAFVPEAPAARKLLLRRGGAVARSLRDAGLGFDPDGAGRFLAPLWELIKQKAAELAAFLAGLLAALAKKADELFPPETRSETLAQWVRVGVTVVLPAALGALVLFWLARCCCRCCCGRRRCGRTMVAPGRGGARMPRYAFEDDPRTYFRDLRAKKPLVY
ncbi:unnamed protein product [Triticum aestivum]|uniref:Uncharacterized protein n=3 Tax=Triticinae TaxID=1648030 RepID=A0A9R1ERD8_WHEAT|nr:uncharacterized protein LOC109786219 [Aegilops tauschii subsp. strangulata]XP_044327960.1 uncharacterized protein LOC123049019 [Triticum aestivum]KAF7014881.1 hypothetical protein CFC21_028814 [Triticum aestivum]SPT17031.1 unnamed protein product [Triticum aestivum]